MPAAPTTVFVVRHGETEWNRGKIFRGTHDIPLNDNGRKQAGTLAGALPRVDAAWSSPLSRAMETAQLALKGRDCPIEKHPGLLDFNYGAWTGLDEFIRSGDDFVAVRINDTSHLRALDVLGEDF